MKQPHGIYETVKKLAWLQEAKMADLSVALGKQQSALQRSLQGNPTVKLLMECAWALGVDWHWLGLPEHKVVDYKDMGLIRFDPAAPINVAVQHKQDRKQISRYLRGRGPGFDPTDKDMLGSVYPPKAIEGVGGQPIDSRFIEAPLPEYDGPTPSHAARRTEGACSTCNGKGWVGGPTYAQPDEGGEQCPDCNALDSHVAPAQQAQQPTVPTAHEAMATEEGRNALRVQLTDVDCGGWVLSDAALEAGRVPVSQWMAMKWTVDKMREHGYLVEGRLLGL